MTRQKGQLTTICPQCGHDWLREFRKFEECHYCLAYLQQSKHKRDFAKSIKKRYEQRLCDICGQDLGDVDTSIKNKGGSFCSLECAIEYRRLNYLG